MKHTKDCSVMYSRAANHKSWCGSFVGEAFIRESCTCWDCSCPSADSSAEDTLCAFAAAGMVACGRCGLVMKPLPQWTGIDGKLCSDCGATINAPSRAAVDAWTRKRDERTSDTTDKQE